MRTSVLVSFLAFLTIGCEPEAAPDCAAWLTCYDGCGPWLDSDYAPTAIAVCDRSCRVDLDLDKTERNPTELGDDRDWAAVVVADLEAAELRTSAAFEVALQARTVCVSGDADE